MSDPAWRRYQEEAAQLFRELGFSATTDVVIEGARNKHAIDVAATADHHGVNQLWVVERKLWNRPVGNDRVAVLADTVADVGADRGVLLSESGFQAGALRRANQSNLTLSSLSDMRENAAEHIAQIQLQLALRRVVILGQRAHALMVSERHDWGGSARTLPGVDGQLLLELFGRLSMTESGLLQATAGSFPALLQAPWDGRTALLAMTPAEAAEHASLVADELDGAIHEQERRANSTSDVGKPRRGGAD